MKYLLITSILLIILNGCSKTTTQPSTNPFDIKSGVFTLDSGLSNSLYGQNSCVLYDDKGSYTLNFDGNTPIVNDGVASSGTQFTIQINLPSDSIKLGQYSTSDGITNMQYQFLFNTNSWEYYFAPATTSNAQIIFDIVSYNPITKDVSITFLGTLDNGTGNLITLNYSTINGNVINFKQQ